MNLRSFLASDPWSRYVLVSFSRVLVRRSLLRVRFALHLREVERLGGSSGRVAAAQYQASVSEYWSIYWALREERTRLDEEEAALITDFLQVQRLVFFTNLLFAQ